MIEEKNTAIITYLDKHFQTNLVYDFLPTLKEHYTGTIVVIDYGMDKKYVTMAEGMGAIVIKFKPNGKIESHRNREILQVIYELPPHISHMMTIDAGDVWFQEQFSTVWNMVEDSIGFVEEDESCDDIVMTNWINKLGDEDVKRLLKGTTLKGSGMMCGPRELMFKFLLRLNNYIELQIQDYFGLDQVAFNYMVMKCSEEMNFTILPSTYDYVLISRNRTEGFYLIDGLIYDKKKKLVKIVHNAGGGHRLFPRGRNYL